MLTLQKLDCWLPNKEPLFTNMGVSLLPGCLLRIKSASGSGKTSLLDMIAGRKKVGKGHILFAGEETRGDAEFFADLLYLPEGFAKYSPRVTVAKQLRNWSHKSQAELIEAAISYFNLEQVLDYKLKDLSVGWLMRVKLSLLIINPSLIWLLDRPFYALDDWAIEKLEGLIAGRCHQNGIVIFTHDGETRLNPHHTLQLDDWLCSNAPAAN